LIVMQYGPLLLTASRASRLLKAIGNERRLLILCHLSEREHSVTELCNLVGLSQSALSQHLAKLRRENLVTTRRSAQTVYYSVASPEVRPILQSLCDLFKPAAETGRTGAALQSGVDTADAPAVLRKSSD
jgi:DNA-binding transcriptional ArsR family regulator